MPTPASLRSPMTNPVDLLIVPVDGLFNLAVVISNRLIVLVDRLPLFILDLPDHTFCL